MRAESRVVVLRAPTVPFKTRTAVARPVAPAPHRSAASLREKGGLTRLMVLRTLHRGDTRTLREVADALGVTVQAVSEHMKRLVEDGLVTSAEDGPRITQEGLEHLRENLAALKEYVDGAVRELARIDATAARAGAAVREGDPVGLFMEDGELVAYPQRASPSQGRAAQEAVPGQDVLVDSLQGIVGLTPGSVVLAVVPDAAEGGSRSVDLDAAKRTLGAAAVVVVAGPVARHVAERVGAAPVRFGGAGVVADAAVRGVDVVLVVEAVALADAETQVERALAERGLAAEPRVVRLHRKRR